MQKKENFVGVDVSKKTLDVALYSQPFSKENHLVVSNNKTGFVEFVKWLKKKKISSKNMFLCMEHTGVYTYNFQDFLEKKEISYCLENALQIKRSMGIVRGKSDKIDAYRIAEYAYEKQHKLKETKRPSTILRKLQPLLTERRDFVRTSSKYKGKKSELSPYLTTGSKKRQSDIIPFFSEKIEKVETEILALISTDEKVKKNYELLLSIKGIGFVNALNAIVYTGNFDSFPDARKYACYVGVAPFSHTSGTSINGKTSVSKLGNKMLKAELSQAARIAIRFDPELKKYFERKFKEKGGTKDAYALVLNAVKFKLILRMFAIIQRQTPYVNLPLRQM